MSEAARAVLSSREIDEYGRQVAAFLRIANTHKEKYHNAKTSAALLLIAVKAQLPHGKYGKWLAVNGIAVSTAARLVQEHADPEAEAKRRAYDATRNAERTAATAKKSPGTGNFAASQAEPPRPAPKQYAQPAQPVSLAGQRIRRLIDQHPNAPVWESMLPLIEQRLKDDQ